MPLVTPPERIAVVLWFDPQCRQSQRAEALLAPLPVDVDRVSLLDTPPDLAALRAMADKLGTGVRTMVRSDLPRFEELDLAAADDETLLTAMARHPDLVQRPLVAVGERAVLARPAELLYRVIAPAVPADGGRQAIHDVLRGKLGTSGGT